MLTDIFTCNFLLTISRLSPSAIFRAASFEAVNNLSCGWSNVTSRSVTLEVSIKFISQYFMKKTKVGKTSTRNIKVQL